MSHCTFEESAVQSQMLFGYMQFNDLRKRFEPGSGQGVEIIGKSLVHVTYRNGFAVASPDITFIGLIDTVKIATPFRVEVNGFLQRADIGQKWVRYREDETTAGSEARTHGAEYGGHFSAVQIADHKYRDHQVELLPRKILKTRGVA